MADDRDWIDREMAIRQIKHEFSPFDEDELWKYIEKCTIERKPIIPFAE